MALLHQRTFHQKSTWLAREKKDENQHLCIFWAHATFALSNILVYIGKIGMPFPIWIISGGWSGGTLFVFFGGIDVGCWLGLFVARALQNNDFCNHACIQVAKPFTQL